MSTDTPTTEMTPEERAARAMSELPDWGFVPGWTITLRERITTEITEAEQAAELRGAERMRTTVCCRSHATCIGS